LTTRGIKSLFCVIGLTGLLAGCTGWFGAPEDPPLPGERISVLALQSTVQPDIELTDQRVILPEPEPMVDWPQNGGYPSHALHHVALDNEVLEQDWSIDIGEGSMDDNLLLNQAIVARGVIFTIDAGAEVRAFAASSGKRIWSLELAPEDEEDSTLLGGGLAYEAGVIFMPRRALPKSLPLMRQVRRSFGVNRSQHRCVLRRLCAVAASLPLPSITRPWH